MTLTITDRLTNRIFPDYLWKKLSKKTKGFRCSQLILSFDCDTHEDIDVAESVHIRLQNIGVTPVYAVPGALLRKGAKVYKKIHESGAEFINHGGRAHTYFNEKHQRHASCFFYDQQPLDVLIEDIELGHQAVKDVLGFTPKGWRTPHFGTFQKQEHLEFLYQTLHKMGYLFSTSTSPEAGFKKGGFYKDRELIEIPVTGSYTNPLSILDTWAYFEASDRSKTPKNYVEECSKMGKFCEKHSLLINIYGDPSHIHGKDEFFEGIEILARSARPTNYSNLIEENCAVRSL